MPPLIAFAGALGGLAVVRWAYRTAKRVNQELEEARSARLAEVSRHGRHSDAASRPQYRCIPAGFDTPPPRRNLDPHPPPPPL